MRLARAVLVYLLLASAAYAQSVKCGFDYCLKSVSLSAPTIVGGNTIQGRVTLEDPTNRDIEVSLATDPREAATVPRTVTAMAGTDSARFEVMTPTTNTVDD